MADRTAITISDSPAFGAGLGDVGYQAADATNDHSLANDGRTVLLVNNASAGAVVVTINVPAGPLSLGAAQTVVKSVAAGKEAFFGPFRQDIFNQTTGLINIDLDVDTTITLAAVRLPSY